MELVQNPQQFIVNKKWYLDKVDDKRNPKEVFQEDLCIAIEEWILQGELIVLAIDIYKYIIEGSLARKLQALGLIEAITTKHKEEWGLVPTYQYGQILINKIFISRHFEKLIKN